MTMLKTFATHSRLLAQAASLLATFIYASVRVLLYLPYALIVILVREAAHWIGLWRIPPRELTRGGAQFYEGIVMHSRRRPKENSFTYPVRIALVDLDHPPPWWREGEGDTMSAGVARRLAGTPGAVRLLTHPPAAGYHQNPISVYYCYADMTPGIEDVPVICIAEVTNTPWGERVSFAFRPGQPESVPKALHVSPLMDMKNTWRVTASAPNGRKLFLSVAVSHPELGNYFLATLDATRDVQSRVEERNELASLRTIWRFGFQPHRVALWIYWQAVILLVKGVPFYAPPAQEEYQGRVEAHAIHPPCANGKPFVWRGPQGWPWM